MESWICTYLEELSIVARAKEGWRIVQLLLSLVAKVRVSPDESTGVAVLK